MDSVHSLVFSLFLPILIVKIIVFIFGYDRVPTKIFWKNVLTFVLTWTQISMTIFSILWEVLTGAWNDNRKNFQMIITTCFISGESTFKKNSLTFLNILEKQKPLYFFPGFPWLSRSVETRYGLVYENENVLLRKVNNHH